jgi:hypothetical protein
MKMSFVETLIYTNIGGILGVIIFLNFSDFILNMWKKYKTKNFPSHSDKRKIFTKSNRRLVRIKIRYGLFGIVILNPVILSIPVSAFLAVKYYGVKSRVYISLIMGQFFWSVIYTIIYTQSLTILV